MAQASEIVVVSLACEVFPERDCTETSHAVAGKDGDIELGRSRFLSHN